MKELLQALQAAQVGEVEAQAPLADHTSYRVGGPAAILVRPAGVDGLRRTLAQVREADVAWAVIGWGSNLIAADTGFDGVVIKLGEAFRYIHIPADVHARAEGEAVPVVVGSATMTNHLVRSLHMSGLSGAEFLALVPGTFGGAVAGNAGTKRGDVGQILESVTVVSPGGDVRELSAADLKLSYRHAELPAGSIVVEGRIRTRRGGVAEGKEAVRVEREYRNHTQPYHEPSAGSVFVNPPGEFAGHLIEAAGLKGWRRGGAHISKLHANFIVTERGARAEDILALMALARRTVRAQFGVQLEPEQRLLGFGQVELAALLDAMPVEDGP